MMLKTLKIALVATATLTMALPAFAHDQPDRQYDRQYDRQSDPYPAAQPYQPTGQYQRELNTYQDQQDNYRSDRAAYDVRRADYERAKADYEARKQRYEADRAAYDDRYGEGAYARVYGPAPAWDANAWNSAATPSTTAYYGGAYDVTARRDFDRRAANYERARARYDARWGYGAYARRYGEAPRWDGSSYDVNAYGRDTAYTAPVMSNPCYQSTRTDTVAGAGIGALVGAALGSNVAAHGRKTEGTVLGALVGAGLGGAVGNAHAKAANAKCDQAGLYFNYADTYPYRETDYDRQARSGDYDYRYYARRGCRLAAAPVNDRGDELRYVRVCPDSEGHYRFTS